MRLAKSIVAVGGVGLSALIGFGVAVAIPATGEDGQRPSDGESATLASWQAEVKDSHEYCAALPASIGDQTLSVIDHATGELVSANAREFCRQTADADGIAAIDASRADMLANYRIENGELVVEYHNLTRSFKDGRETVIEDPEPLPPEEVQRRIDELAASDG